MVTERFIVPCPLVSRGKPVLAVPGGVALPVGVGPERVFVRCAWGAGSASADPCPPPPSAYRLESSASSRDGVDGEWRLELSVAGNTSRERGHVLEFDGQSWLRLVAEGDSGAALLSLRVHDASDGTDDTWLVLGDDPGLLLAERGEPGLAELIYERYPGYSPALFDQARAGELPAQALARLEGLLALLPDVRHVLLSYAAAPPSALEPLLLALLAAERRPCVGGWTDREAVAALEARHGLVPGPNLGAWFAAYPGQLAGARRPTAEGAGAVQRLWADALDVLYVPQ